MSRAADWLTAIDDGLRGWLHRCTLCGGQQGEAWWDIAEVGAYAIAVKVCTVCRARDPEQCTLTALLQQRYGPVRHAD